VGTPQYMSPEQIKEASDVDGRSDLWSLGACLYRLLTGVHPFPGDNILEIVGRILKEDPRPVRERRPDVPEAPAEIVEKCLEKRPKDRYATVQELADALEAALTRDDRTVPLARPSTARAPRPSRAPLAEPQPSMRARWVVAGVLLLASMAVVVAL